MSYSFIYKKNSNKPQQDDLKSRLSKINPSHQQQIISIKYYHNHLQQNNSYFIIVQNKSPTTNQPNNNQQTKLKIKKLFIKQSALESQNLLNKQKKSQKNNQQNMQQCQKMQPDQNARKDRQLQCTVRFEATSGDISSQSGQKQKQQANLTADIVSNNFFSRIVCSNFIHENVFLILQDPFQLYFITPKNKNPIKIILQNTFPLTNLQSYFSFQSNDQQKNKQPYNLLVFGYNVQNHTNTLLSINLMTFEVKQVTQPKQYSPKSRFNNFQFFNDDRLYVFGGQNPNKKQIQQLLWSYDIDKGYWFALQMKYNDKSQLFQNYNCTIFDSGKVIILNDDKTYVLEIYQCKITEILQTQYNVNKIWKQNQIKGIFCFEKNILAYNKKGILQDIFQLQKIKI